MDPRLDGPFNCSDGYQSTRTNYRDEDKNDYEFSSRGLQNQSSSSQLKPIANSVEDNNYRVDCEFSDGVLRYIDQMLMEEEMDEQMHTLQESLDFQAKERSFYEVLGQKYPPSPLQESAPNVDQYSERQDNNCSTASCSDGGGYLIDAVEPSWLTDYSVSNSFINGMLDQNPKESEINKEEDDGIITKSSHGKARCKQNAIFGESNVPTEDFDDVWVYTLGERDEKLAAYIADLKISASNKTQQRGAKGMRQSRRKEAIDLTPILIDCAKAVAADDRASADEFLRQIRRHSSPSGDGNQRLAHYFANGLEARLAGNGSQVHHALDHKRITDSDHLKAYCTSFISSSFRKLSNFASNKLIMTNSEKATKVHIIDFGIFYGFQWPSFIQRVAERKGGPPKLRITGIDFPQPGSRPAERIEDTGRRLAHYAKIFNVPFEYNAIAQRWETIKIEDLKIKKGEFLAVNCSYRAKNLLDETAGEVSSRTMVLDLIRKINPDIFIHGIVNGSYNLPLFFYRFREALFHYSTLFDMADTIIPCERPERMLVESMLGNEVLNVIACEGSERVERPETYKQWQMRLLRAGFMQILFERKLMNTVMHKVRKFYHKDFVVNEENNWMLMSWNGRIIYAVSCWKPV